MTHNLILIEYEARVVVSKLLESNWKCKQFQAVPQQQYNRKNLNTEITKS
jgi:hypothetical protein